MEVVIAHTSQVHQEVCLRPLTQVGSPSVIDATGNYSVTPQTFQIAPAAGEDMFIFQIKLVIETATAAVGNKYGDVTCTNGFHAWMDVNGHTDVVIDSTMGVKDLIDLIGASHEYKHYSLTSDICMGIFDFTKLFGNPMYLNGDNGDSFNVEWRDDLSALVQNRMIAQGYIA